MGKINNDPYIKTIRAIKNSNIDLKPKISPTPLDPHNIQTSSLALVHMTNYEPENGMILSTRDKIGGSRSSVHFTLNHAVTAHRAGDWDNMKYAIIMPFDSTVKANTKSRIIEGMPNDIYTNGSVKIPEGAVIIKNNPNIKEGEINIKEHPTIKGVKILETSGNIHNIVPTVLEKMGYTHMKGDGPTGQFNYGKYNGNDVDDAVANYTAWKNFCISNNLKPTRHSASPTGISEKIIEHIGQLCANKTTLGNSSWNAKNTNFKLQILDEITFLKEYQAKGYHISFDLDKLEQIVRSSSTPQIALSKIEKELGFSCSIKYDEFNYCMVESDLKLYQEILESLEFLDKYRDYLIKEFD